MSSIPAAVVRRHRVRTGLVLSTAAAAITAAALLGPAPRSPRRAAPATALGISAALPGHTIAAGRAETHLAIALTAPDAPASRRSPASLAIVFDRSGSMRGEPLTQAKAAALALIERLAPDDEVALVSYADGATLDLPLTFADEAGKARLRQAIAWLSAGGNTAMGAGLERGGLALSRAHHGVRRIVLLSDGKPTRSDGRPVSPEVARAELVGQAGERAAAGVSVTAVGFGLEYDEALMAAIASAGRGNYYYAERGARLAELFVDELASLGRTVIAESELRITPAPGVALHDVLGYHFQRDAAGVVTVPVTDLTAGARQKVVLALRTDLAPGTEVAIATIAWRFRVVGGAAEERVAELRARVSADAGAVAASLAPAAVAMIEEARTAVAIDAAAASYAEGDLTSARAILDLRAAEASAAAAKVGDRDLDARLRGYTAEAERAFAAPPASPGAGKAAVKASRAGAYELAR